MCTVNTPLLNNWAELSSVMKTQIFLCTTWRHVG